MFAPKDNIEDHIDNHIENDIAELHESNLLYSCPARGLLLPSRRRAQ
jgi:hypothetical protein